VLDVQEVSVRFGDTLAVDRVSFELEAGEVLAVLGPSGCGKSTLLRAVAGLEELRSGSVLLDGRDLNDTPTHRRGFALMFQDGQLFAQQSVAENVGYPLRLRRTPRHEVHARVAELLELVGLPDHGDRRPMTLSGGEQQRVALARALAAEPRLLLLDEPLSALDRTLRERLAGDLREILVATGTTALLVTHDHDEAFTVADRMGVMFDGRLVQQGPTLEVWRAPADERIARFLGFQDVLRGEPARRLLGAAGAGAGRDRAGAGRDRAGAGRDRAGDGAAAPGVAEVGELGDRAVAVRRSAVWVTDDGPLSGTVRDAVAVTDAVRVELDVDGVGRLEALAAQSARLDPGARVRLKVYATGLAVVPGGGRREVSQPSSES
jgi:thiamine transport system ATP-binding protein